MANEMKIALRQTAASTSEAAVRQHKILIDRPAAKGGDDRGPMGGELFLAAIGGCFMSNLLAAIKAREAINTIAAIVIITRKVLEARKLFFSTLQVPSGAHAALSFVRSELYHA